MTWQAAWEESRTPWDAGQSPPILTELVTAGTLPNGRALVTGAGSGYDVRTLATAERAVTGIDLSPVAKQRFDSLSADHPHRDQLDYVVGDLFAYAPAEPFDMVWDYTCLCALEPQMRADWAAAMHRLLHPTRGELVALIFPVVPGKDPTQGPPYPMTTELVEGLISAHFETVSIEPVERSHPGREGKEWLGRFRRRG